MNASNAEDRTSRRMGLGDAVLDLHSELTLDERNSPVADVAPNDRARVLLRPAESLAHQRTKIRQAADTYLKRGYALVPVPAGQKGPILRGWQKLRLTQKQVPEAFRDAGNIGILLGIASGDLVDVDLDCPEARDLADRFLPPTEAITGRLRSPRSHRWYICPDVGTVRHRDPVTRESIVELRGIGSQTLVGPSIHPSGDPYDLLAGDPASVDAKSLCEAVERLAAEVIRLRHGEIALKQAPAAVLAHPLPSVGGDRKILLRRASAYLGAMPPAISGQGGHNATYAAATALVHGFGLAEAEALALLQTQFNPRCQPPWTEKELIHKVTEAAARPHARARGWLVSPT